MLRFLKKRWKKYRKSETLTRQATGAECGEDSDDINHKGSSQTATQDTRNKDQQLPAPNASTSTPGHGSGDTNIRNLEELEDRAPGVQQPLETTPERTFGGGTHDLVQSERSRVKEDWVDRAFGSAAVVADLAKGPAEAFDPLRVVLGSIYVVYAQYQNKMDILRSRVPVLEKLFGNPTSDEEAERREGLLIKLKEIGEQLLQSREKSAPPRFVDNAHDSEDSSELLEDLQEALLDYMMVQQMAIYDQGCEHMNTAEKSILNTFRRAKGAEFRQDERKGCLKGTREDVLNTIELWARDPSKSPVYWLNGLAGTGKSTIAKTIAERLFADNLLGASFFCSRDFGDRRNLQLIFPTLAIQLARKYPEFRSIFVPLVQSDPEVAYESLYNQMRRLIVQPLKQSGISTVIVIDALDECEDDESASAILSVLGRLVSEIPKVKFFLTGRPEPRVYQGFRLPLLAKITGTFVLHDVERDQVNSDMRLFFRTSFLELATHRSGLDNWPTEEQLDLLCGRAAGLFVYAAATVRFVGNGKREPRDQLDLLLESQKVGAHEGETLDSLYTSILQEAFDDNDPEDDAKTRSVLGVVILAVNPLSPSAIATLLGYDTEDVLPLLSPAKSLLVLQEDVSHPVRPFHKSFPDFITDSTRCIDPRFHISPPDHHSQLLMSCLGLTDRTLAKNMCKLPDGVANSDVSDLKERIEEYINPALRYACLSWHMHLVDADTIPAYVPTISSTLHQFLEKMFLFWLEVLSVLGAARDAVETLQTIAGWSEESSTLDLANDCLRFVTGYSEVINASAPHIYHSALVSTPKKSLVRELYESHARPFTRVVHGLPMSWGANTAATTRPTSIKVVAWSPCDKFIAIAWFGTMGIEILDSLTLQRLQTLGFLRGQRISVVHMALVFSPDSRILTCFGTSSPGREVFVISWDLQTGGVVSVIRREGSIGEIKRSPSITYSANGKMVGVRYLYHPDRDVILTFDVSSGVYMHSHSPASSIPHPNGIWIHGECLRFATVGTKTITIWEVGFTSGVIPTEVETLPSPEEYLRDWDGGTNDIEFLPTPCRLALDFQGTVTVWDAQNAKYLLHRTPGTRLRRWMAFSSNGRFFAYSTRGSDIYLWKESPTGYILHKVLEFKTGSPRLLLSRDGGSIVTFGGPTIWLWRTKGFATPPSTPSTQTPPPTEPFVLDFSSDGMLAAVAMLKDKTVTVLNLESGVLQLTIDAGMGVYGLEVIGNTIAVIGDQKVITWDLSTGDRIPDTKMTLEDSARTMNLGGSVIGEVTGTSISPDSRHVVLATLEWATTVESEILVSVYRLYIYDGSTGEQLAQHTVSSGIPFFAPGGCDLWLVGDGGRGEVLRVGSGGQVLRDRERRVDVKHPPEGYPWTSSRGYRVTNDWWILGPDEKRLLMLPPFWQYPVDVKVLQVWKGRFLALLHRGLPEPVILELDR